jgi:3-hydroxyanthranilate 3,4-dioxygenase
MSVSKPFNLKQWIEDNRDLLKPPVGNKNLYKDAQDYIVMIITTMKQKSCFINLKGK